MIEYRHGLDTTLRRCLIHVLDLGYTSGETIEKDLDLNGLFIDTIYDRI